jgi:hypothetical protein
MLRNRIFSLAALYAAALITSSVVDHALAQGFGISRAPTSTVGGAAGQQLTTIKQQGIGVGYTGSALNQLTLFNTRAQVPFSSYQSSVTSGSGVNAAPRLGKPFSGYSPAPTVSPYLNLFRNDLSGGSDLNYQTLVRPQLQQQQFNTQAQRANFEIARRVQSIAAQGDYNISGSKELYPTGHQTVFQYYGHYYPAFSQPRRQKRQ